VSNTKLQAVRAASGGVRFQDNARQRRNVTLVIWAGVPQRLQGGFCKPVTVGSSPTAGYDGLPGGRVTTEAMRVTTAYPLPMQPVKPKWLESGLVLVCERCSKERIPEESPEIAQRIGDFSLRDWLKSELKAHDEWGPIRVISTSCMDVCAKGKVTVCLDRMNGDAAEVTIVDPIEERDALYDRVVKTLSRRS
jgi:hypothetical protein